MSISEPELTGEERENAQFVRRSPQRLEVLDRLQEEPASRARVGMSRGVNRANAASVLSELQDRNLVERLTTEDEVAYGLTAEGELVLFEA